MKKIIKRSLLFIGVLAVIFLTFVYFKGKDAANSKYETATVARGDVIQTVEESGTVKSAKEVNLSFLQAGRIAEFAVKIGDKVTEGQLLARLDATGFYIEKKQAEAGLLSAKSQLGKLLAGTTSEDLAVARANTDKAKTAYETAQDEYNKTKNRTEESVRQAEQSLDDLNADAPVVSGAVRADEMKTIYGQAAYNKKNSALTTIENKNLIVYNTLDDIKTILNDDDAKGVLSIKDSSYIGKTISARENALDFWTEARASLSAAETAQSREKINPAMNSSLDFLNETLAALNNCFKMLEKTITSSSFTQAELDAYKTVVNADISSVNTAISSVETARQNLDDAILSYNNAVTTARNSLNTASNLAEEQMAAARSKVDNAQKTYETAQKELVKAESGYNQYDIEAARAQASQAQAAVDSANKKIEDSMIKSPIDGIVTKRDYEVGEYVSQNSKAISVLNEGDFEIELDVSESDIAKVKVGDSATIDLDAFGEDVKFLGRVYFIDPAETVIQDVIYYKVKIEFLDREGAEKYGWRDKIGDWNVYGDYFGRIKSGMTANVSILTAEKKSVFVVPFRAVIDRNGSGKIIRVPDGSDSYKEAPVEIGLKGDDGNVEIVSGASENEKVIISIKEK